MKNTLQILLWILIGIIASAVLFLVTAPPRGTAVELLPAPSPAPIQVHVDGAVKQPGVYALPPGSRVQAAIQAAGGLTGQANQNAVNLAARLADGDKLRVPEIGAPGEPAAAQDPDPTPAASKSKSIPAAVPGAPLNLNTATLDELQTLPGIGLTRAQQIIDYRQAHGGFHSIDELKDISGIGDATFARLKDLVIVK